MSIDTRANKVLRSNGAKSKFDLLLYRTRAPLER
jgi:hypothetical protein